MALEPALREYLLEVPLPLRRSLLHASGQNLADALQAIDDLGIDAGSELMALLRRGRREHADLVVDALRWSRDEEVGQQLRRLALRHINPAQRSQRRRRPYPTRRATIPGDLPYRSILRSLRGHPSAETERFLLLAAQDFDPAYRAQALGSLGWWEPFLRDEVRHSLETARRDPKQEVRQAARGALARLGERAALHWIRQALHSDNPQQVFEAVHVTASEGLTLLWPDIDRLADSENAEIAHHARESLERLSEELELPRAW